MTFLRRWRPALRMARRDLFSHPLRAVVTTLLVAFPVAVAVIASTLAVTLDYDSTNSLYPDYGTADARLTVTPYPRIRNELAPDGRYADFTPATARRGTGPRDPGSVDVGTLLPEGSRVTRVGVVDVVLSGGGSLGASIVDLDDPLTRGLEDIRSGRAPTRRDEAAVAPLVADELGLLDDDGRLRPDATLDLVDGRLHVVGLLAVRSDAYGYERLLAVPPSSSVATAPAAGDDPDEIRTVDYLVDLPAMSSARAVALQRALAEVGVSSWFRDGVDHPASWGLDPPPPTPVEPVALAVGGLVIGLGLTEVLALVGATFAVATRRQQRSLGLLVSAGGTPADVRRTVLAQGLWVGCCAAALGLAAGGAALVWGRELLGRLVGTTIYDYSVPVGGLVAVAVLGVASAVAAAAIPAWGVGRRTAAQTLDGHVDVATRSGDPRRHRFRNAGLAVVSVGLVGLLGSGWWIARTFASPDASAMPVVLGGLSALVLLVGTALLVPWSVTMLGRAGARGWLPWRLAVRDATRHRGRTTAAVLAIGILTTGAVFTGFGVAGQASVPASTEEPWVPPGTAELYLSAEQHADTALLPRIEQTVGQLVGADGVQTWHHAYVGRRQVLDRAGSVVRVVDESYLLLAGVDRAGREAFARGDAVVTAETGEPAAARRGTTLLRTGAGPRAHHDTVPAHPVRLDWAPVEQTWISATTATELGYTLRPAYDAWVSGVPAFTSDDELRLQLHGLQVTAPGSYVLDQTSYVLPVAVGVLVVTALVVGMVVALAASEGRDDTATLAAVGATGWMRRAVGSSHALFVGLLGTGAGVLLGSVGGGTLFQVFDTPGTPIPWSGLLVLLLGVPLLCLVIGWLATPTRLSMTRRTG